MCCSIGKAISRQPPHWVGLIDEAPQGRNLSLQQREAYTAQDDPAKVLKAVRILKPVHP